MIVTGSLTELTLRSLREDEDRVDLEDEDTARILDATGQFAAAALEAGVSHPWRDWVQFTAIERLAWVQAARLVRTQEARRSALAARGEAGYLLAGVDVEGDAVQAADEAIADEHARRVARG